MQRYPRIDALFAQLLDNANTMKTSVTRCNEAQRATYCNYFNARPRRQRPKERRGNLGRLVLLVDRIFLIQAAKL